MKECERVMLFSCGQTTATNRRTSDDAGLRLLLGLLAVQRSNKAATLVGRQRTVDLLVH
jgi:hypothetical protein